jgi:hypothetical protein
MLKAGSELIDTLVTDSNTVLNVNKQIITLRFYSLRRRGRLQQELKAAADAGRRVVRQVYHDSWQSLMKAAEKGVLDPELQVRAVS